MTGKSRGIHVCVWAVATTMAVVGPALGCHQDRPEYNAAPPTIVCGVTISRSPMGVSVALTFMHTTMAQRYTTPDGLIFLRLMPGCAHGGGYEVRPAAVATVTTVVKARDGKPLVVVVRPTTQSFDVVVTRPPSASIPKTLVHVRLPAGQLG